MDFSVVVVLVELEIDGRELRFRLALGFLPPSGEEVMRAGA